MQWGDKWLPTPQVGGAPVIVEHNDCGHDISGAVRCGHCQQPATAATVTARIGPGSEPDA